MLPLHWCSLPSVNQTISLLFFFSALSNDSYFHSMSGMISGGHNTMGAAGTSPSTNDLASLIQAWVESWVFPIALVSKWIWGFSDQKWNLNLTVEKALHPTFQPASFGDVNYLLEFWQLAVKSSLAPDCVRVSVSTLIGLLLVLLQGPAVRSADAAAESWTNRAATKPD